MLHKYFDQIRQKKHNVNFTKHRKYNSIHFIFVLLEEKKRTLLGRDWGKWKICYKRIRMIKF